MFSRKTKSARKLSVQRSKHSSLRLEPLEQRDMMSVSQLWFSGNLLVVKADTNATSVEVSQSGSTVKITEVNSGSANRTWQYTRGTASGQVNSVEFQGSDKNDR